MSLTTASNSARSYSSDTVAFNRPMYAPGTTGVQVLTDEWTEYLRNDLSAGEVVECTLHFCNRAEDSNFSVCVVPHGETAGNDFLIYDETPAAAGESLTPPFRPVLRPGEAIWAKASDLNTINLVINYLSEQ